MKQKYRYILLILLGTGIAGAVQAQQLSGTVTDSSDGSPVSGALVSLKKQQKTVLTDSLGRFSFTGKLTDDLLEVSLLGYQKYSRPWAKEQATVTVRLQQTVNTLQEVVVSTGYQQLNKERATGSFEQVDRQLLNRSVGPNILDRLEAVTGSLLFDRRNRGNPKLQIRGLIQNERFPVDYTLVELAGMLDPAMFFHVNRKFIIHIDAAKEIHPYFKGRLKLVLQPPVDEEVLVSSQTSSDFKAWLDQ